MSWLEAGAALGIPWWLGYLLVRGERPGLGLAWRDDPWAFLGWVHVTGCLATGLYLAAWLLLGLPLQRTTVLVPLLILGAVLHWRLHRQPPPPANRRPVPVARPAPRWQDLLFGGVVAAVLVHGAGSIASGNARAVVAGDEILHWTLKGKMIYAAGGFGPEFEQLVAEKTHPTAFWRPLDEWIEATWPLLTEAVRERVPKPGTARGYHLDYPLLNPLLHVWAFLCADQILHWQNRLLIQGFGLALLLILAGALRRCSPPLLAAGLLIVAFAMLDTRSALRWCYADGMVATGVLLALDGLTRFRLGGPAATRWWRLAVVGLALLVWSKNEGLLYLAVIALAAVATGLRPTPRAALGLALPLGLIALTWISNAVFGFRNDLATLEPGGGLERAGTVAGYLFGQIYTGAAWATDAGQLAGNWLYPTLFLLVLIAPGAAFAPSRRLLTITLLAMAAVHLLVYVYTPHELLWHLGESAQRVVWQTLPCVTVWLAGMAVAHLDP